jgi:hypothetical protein
MLLIGQRTYRARIWLVNAAKDQDLQQVRTLLSGRARTSMFRRRRFDGALVGCALE